MSNIDTQAPATVPAPVRKQIQRPKKPNARYVEVMMKPEGGVCYFLRPEGYNIVAQMIAGGQSEASVAAVLGMNPSTLTEMKKRDEVLRDAMSRGRGALEDEVVGKLVEHMRNDNVAAAIFLAKGKLGFREVGPTDPNAPQTAIQVNISVPPALDASQVQQLIGHTIPTPDPTDG